MQGRDEDKLIQETKIKDKIKDYPDYLMGFFYFMNNKSYTTKLNYINVVIRMINTVENEEVIDCFRKTTKDKKLIKVESDSVSDGMY